MTRPTRKRSRHVALFLAGSAVLALAACEEEKTDAAAFPDLASCVAEAKSGNLFFTEQDCQTQFAAAEQTHLETAPRYESKELCEKEHGAGQCEGDTGGAEYGRRVFLHAAARGLHDGLDAVARRRHLFPADGAHGGQQHLLGGAHTRVRQVDVSGMQSVGRGQAQAVLALLDHRPEGAQHVEVVVDGAFADATAPEVGDERLAEAVQQRATEQHGDPGGSGVGVDVGDVGLFDVGRIEDQFTVTIGGVDDDAVQLEQAADDLHVGDLGHPAQAAPLLGEHHRDVGQHPAAVVTGDEVAADHHLGQLGREADPVGQKAGGDAARMALTAGLVDGRYRKKLEAGRRDLVIAALQRRGFSYSVIKEAIRRVEEGE